MRLQGGVTGVVVKVAAEVCAVLWASAALAVVVAEEVAAIEMVVVSVAVTQANATT